MFISRLKGTLFSRNCLLCQQKLDFTGWICDECDQHLPRIQSACPICAAAVNQKGVCGFCLSQKHYFDNTLVPFEYKQPINRLIYQFKYQQHFYAYRPLVEELISMIKQIQQPVPELIIPVPLHPRRIRQRGFNQSGLIARALAKEFNVNHNNCLIIRHKFSKPQVELSAKERQQAVQNAFTVVTKTHTKHIALVDDVITTTQTVNQVARALKQAGVEKISIWALARNT